MKTLYYDSISGLIPVRRASIELLPHGIVRATVARTKNAYRAGESLTFGRTWLVVKSRQRGFRQLVVNAFDAEGNLR